jgi:alkylation response protein AidB-like acyl-CoA dehydrogenase
MDFALTNDQTALRDLARTVLSAHSGTFSGAKIAGMYRQKGDPALWSALADADLLGVAVPEDVGGLGYGIVELCLLAEEAGRAAAPAPIVSVLTAALPIAEFGSDEQRKRLLPDVVAGATVVCAALGEDDIDATGSLPSARREPDGWSLHGVRDLVPLADSAARVVVPARSSDGVIVVLVDPRGEGVELAPQRITTREIRFAMKMEGARISDDDVVSGPHEGAHVLQWAVERALVTLCALQLGTAERALEMTASYLSERVQFGRPVASFQAVQQRLADCYIDVEAMRWTSLRAAWVLSQGLDAGADVAVAKFWAADGGRRVLAAAQHLHGGIGVDIDYALHRYTLTGKHTELHLGGANRHLARLGAMMAGEPS